MKPILAYSDIARPKTADEGQEFINITTQKRYIFKDGSWHIYTEPPKKRSKKTKKETEE